MRITKSCAAGYVLAVLLAAPTQGQESKPAPAPPRTASNPADKPATAAVTIPVYPASPEGLKKLVKDILATALANRNQPPSAYMDAFVLPDPQAWFRSALGEENGGATAAEYTDTQRVLPEVLAKSFALFLDEHLSEIESKRFDKPCDVTTTEGQYRFLLGLQQPTPLYEVRALASDRRGGRALWFFTYVDGAFRYVGHPSLPTFHKASPAGNKRIRVGGNVQGAKLLHKVAPIYPEEAKRVYLQGTVKLQALIGTDGTIGELGYVGGPCVLAESAMKAVRQWRYQPTLLNGEPVEVLTTVDAVFTLRR